MRARLSAWGLGGALRRMLGIRLGCFHQYAPRPLSLDRIDKWPGDADLPRISLVTPSFNQAAFIGATVASVLGQAYPHLDYVVQDACSSDGTADILRGFRGQGVDIRIQPDGGQADALNIGFRRTSGEIMGYLNSDDLLLPGTLDFVGRYFRDHPEVDVIYGNRLIVDRDGREIGRWILPGHHPQLLRFVDYIPQETMFWRRRLWERIDGGFDASLRFALDWELILRFVEAGAVFQHIPQLFGLFRVHEEQKSQADFIVRGAPEMANIRQRHAGKSLRLSERMACHCNFLLQHRRADAKFAATQGIKGVR